MVKEKAVGITICILAFLGFICILGTAGSSDLANELREDFSLARIVIQSIIGLAMMSPLAIIMFGQGEEDDK